MNVKFVPLRALACAFGACAFGACTFGACAFGAIAPALAVNPPTEDAQTAYSAQEIAVARRAFRSQCVLYQPAERCECYTAGFAQALTPPELRLATALLSTRFASTEARRARATQAAMRRAKGMGFADEASRQEAMSRIDDVETELAPICNAA
jgi:hypothetical protein